MQTRMVLLFVLALGLLPSAASADVLIASPQTLVSGGEPLRVVLVGLHEGGIYYNTKILYLSTIKTF